MAKDTKKGTTGSKPATGKGGKGGAKPAATPAKGGKKGGKK